MTASPIVAPAGCCPVPPAGYGTAEWEADRAPLERAFGAQHQRALEMQAGARDPFTAEQRRMHQLGPDDAFPPRWLQEPVARADASLWYHADEVDLRALGYCRTCGRPTQLEQVGRSVYSSCSCYRAQGDLTRMQAYLDDRRPLITAERRAALLALIGVPAVPVAEVPGA